MAARLRREIGGDVEVEGGPYGQFQVLVDGEVVVNGGPWAALGVLPSGRAVVEAVKVKLSTE